MYKVWEEVCDLRIQRILLDTTRKLRICGSKDRLKNQNLHVKKNFDEVLEVGKILVGNAFQLAYNSLKFFFPIDF